MMHSFFFKGKKSQDFGIYISGSGTYNFPERDIEKVEVPGRNGDLLIDNKRYKNVTLTYPAFVREKFKELTDVARMWLMADPEYQRLEDTYHPEQFRVARFTGPMDWDMKFMNRSGECNLTFDCKPQRYLKLGEHPVVSEGKVILFNPTGFEALPLIRVYGTSGDLVVGNTVVQIKTIDGYMDIDSETQNAYKGLQNCNRQIYAPVFPSLPAGKTGIMTEGNIEKIEIIPRWWTT